MVGSVRLAEAALFLMGGIDMLICCYVQFTALACVEGGLTFCKPVCLPDKLSLLFRGQPLHPHFVLCVTLVA